MQARNVQKIDIILQWYLAPLVLQKCNLLFYLLLLPWVYCLIPWASLAHLLHLYLLSLLQASWPSFLPCQPIEFTTLFLGLPWPIYFFLYLSLSPWACDFIPWASLTHLPLSFTSCYFHRLVGYHSCHVSPLGLLPYSFYHLPLVFLSFPLLLGFFCCQAFCQKWASTP